MEWKGAGADEIDRPRTGSAWVELDLGVKVTPAISPALFETQQIIEPARGERDRRSEIPVNKTAVGLVRHRHGGSGKFRARVRPQQSQRMTPAIPRNFSSAQRGDIDRISLDLDLQPDPAIEIIAQAPQ